MYDEKDNPLIWLKIWHKNNFVPNSICYGASKKQTELATGFSSRAVTDFARSRLVFHVTKLESQFNLITVHGGKNNSLRILKLKYLFYKRHISRFKLGVAWHLLPFSLSCTLMSAQRANGCLQSNLRNSGLLLVPNKRLHPPHAYFFTKKIWETQCYQSYQIKFLFKVIPKNLFLEHFLVFHSYFYLIF